MYKDRKKVYSGEGHFTLYREEWEDEYPYDIHWLDKYYIEYRIKDSLIVLRAKIEPESNVLFVVTDEGRNKE